MTTKKAKLEISPDLSLPLEAVTNTYAILARRRVGKTYTASVTGEEMVSAGLPWVALDPTGAWWGLSSSANGKAEGLPVVIIGGPHAHIPLEPSAGKVIADLVVDYPGWYIIDFSRFNHRAEEIRFSTEFGERLYRRKQHAPSALHLFIDEADFFVPQKLPKGGKEMFDAYDQIVRRGGVYGLGVTLISQRPALINKDVLTQCAVLIALRTSAPEDQDPIFDKVARNGTHEQVKQIRKTLASLATGEAWYFEPDRDIFKMIRIRERFTFNSSATPKPGVAAIQPKIFSKVDLESLGEKIKSTVEKARLDDPQYLRGRIHTLEIELASQPKAESIQAVPAQPIEIKIPVMDEGQYKDLAGTLKSFDEKAADLQKQIVEFADRANTDINNLILDIAKPAYTLEKIRESINGYAAAQPSTPRAVINGIEYRQTQKNPPVRNFAKKETRGAAVYPGTGAYRPIIKADSESLSGPEQKILDSVAWLESIGQATPLKKAVAILAGYTPDGGGFNNPCGSLRAKGLIDYEPGKRMYLTEQGRTVANFPESALTQEAIQNQVLRIIDGPQKRILEPLLAAWPQAINKDQLASMAGYTPRSGGFNNPIGRLRTMGIVEYSGKNEARAAGFLFLEA